MTKENQTSQDRSELDLNLAELDVIYRTAPVGLCVLDQELRYIRINDWLAEINGYPPEAHIGRTVREMVPKLADKVEPLYRQVLETGEPLLGIEIRAETNRYPGVERVFKDRYHPLLDAHGNVVGVNVVVEEVTELKQEEEMRRISEARFRALANSMPQLVWTADPDGSVDYYNERYREFAGISPQPDGSWQWAAVVHPDDLARTADAWRHAVASGEQYAVEHRVQRADGSYRWYLSRGEPVRDEAGRIAKWYGTATDIHELRITQQALRELNDTLERRISQRTRSLEEAHQAMQKARDLFYTLFSANPIPTVITRPEDGLVIDANDAFLHFYGFSREEFVGSTTLEMGIYWDPADRASLMETITRGGHVHEVELRLKSRSAGVRTVLASMELVEINGESLVLAVFFDVTPLVTAQTQIRHLASELSLAEERERRRIAQILHDDIQQMLVAVQIMLQMQSWDSETEGEREALKKADEYLAQTLTATRELSSELSAPAITSRAVQDSLALLASFMEERYGLVVALSAGEAGEIADEDLRGVVIRLVRELLFNVVKHAGVRRAQLAAWREGDDLFICVRDKGQGLVPQMLDPERTGAGLGLASMGERLALFGGELDVDAAPGSGTKVTIRVPVSKARSGVAAY
ncbi:MAG: PAS domain-containing protein [Chloroflexi bacterium]|nr:PAS domain-containing protein [Chloroflexota bacterium]